MKMILLLVSFAVALSAQDMVFLGEPVKMIGLSDGDVTTKPLSALQGKEFQCRITRTLNVYNWQSRGNVEMERVETGGFTWFFAVDGSGYVKIVKRGGPLDVFQHDYVEHLHVALGSINYYGKAAINRK